MNIAVANPVDIFQKTVHQLGGVASRQQGNVVKYGKAGSGLNHSHVVGPNEPLSKMRKIIQRALHS